MAWLNSSADKGEHRVSRLERRRVVKGDGEQEPIPMPPLEGDEAYMIKLLMELGPVVNNGMGINGVSWQDINSWTLLTGVELSSWQASTLHLMSKAYANEYSRSNGENTHAPYIPEADDQEARDRVSAGLKSFFKQYMAARKNIPEEEL